MSFQRGLAAFRLEGPAEIPHTQYITHPAWLAALRERSGRPEAGFAELLDFDFVWHVDQPPIRRGRWTDMGHGIWQADGSDYRRASPSPFTELEAIYSLDPFQEYGRIDVQEQAARYQAWYDQASRGDYVISGGTYRSVVSFAIAAFGWENLLLAAGEDPARFGAVLDRWTDYLLQYVEAWARTSIAIYHTHDDLVWASGSIFRPEFYRHYVFPNLRRQWDVARAAGKHVLFTSDGDFSEYVDDLAAAGAGGFVFEPCTDLAAICPKYGRTHVIIGNADTRILAFGTPEDVYQEVGRCLDLGRPCPGYFFAVGNHIPPNVPIANAEACIAAYRELRRR